MAYIPCNYGSSGGTFLDADKGLLINQGGVINSTIPRTASDAWGGSSSPNGLWTIIANITNYHTVNFTAKNAYTPYVQATNDFKSFVDYSGTNVDSITIGSSYKYVIIHQRNGSAGVKVYFT